MPNTINRDQLEQAIKEMVSQSELFSENLSEKAEILSDEDLEKLTLTLQVALQTEKKLTDEEQQNIQTELSQYFESKQRIYQKAQNTWRQKQEAAHEAQESLFEESLLANL